MKCQIGNEQQVGKETQPQVEFLSSVDRWDALYQLAATQAGLVSLAQAKEIGFSDQLTSKHVESGRLERVQRGIYRVTRLPTDEHEEYVAAWLWSGRRGVISHESALQLHALSDALPARLHITLPGRRADFHAKVPALTIVHFADIPDADRAWIGAVPVTRPARTINDVALDHGDAILVEQAIEQGIMRRLFHVSDVARAAAYTASLSLPGTPIFPEAVADWGGGWAFRELRGRFSGKPATDWPALAAGVAAAFGGRIYSQQRFPRSNELLLGLVFPLPGPSSETWVALQYALGKALSWSR